MKALLSVDSQFGSEALEEKVDGFGGGGEELGRFFVRIDHKGLLSVAG